MQWRTSILLRSALRRAASIVEPEGCGGRLGDFDRFKLEMASNQDRQNLRSNLELLRQGHVCDASCVRSQTEACLAAQLLERLDGWPTALVSDQAATAETLPSLLWKVLPRDLPVLRFFENVNEIEWLGEKYAMEVFRDVGSEGVKQEFEILASLCHPHVLRLVCWSEDRTVMTALLSWSS